MTPPRKAVKKVRFKRFAFGKGYTWRAGDEGEVVAETDTFYKVKTSWLNTEWVWKDEAEEITTIEP